MTSVLKVIVACVFVLAPSPRPKSCDSWHADETICMDEAARLYCRYHRSGDGSLRQECHVLPDPLLDPTGTALYWECMVRTDQAIVCTNKVQLRLHFATKFHADFKLPP